MALPHASVINCVRKVHIGRKQIYSNRLKDYAVLDPGKKNPGESNQDIRNI